jgi:hypothetical protein
VAGDGVARQRNHWHEQLEKTVSWSTRERLRCLWYRLRLTVAEMNYATRRAVEVQARCRRMHPSNAASWSMRATTLVVYG